MNWPETTLYCTLPWSGDVSLQNQEIRELIVQATGCILSLPAIPAGDSRASATPAQPPTCILISSEKWHRFLDRIPCRKVSFRRSPNL